jgi:galactokinase/mevalonate kinase-like predicted kinase
MDATKVDEYTIQVTKEVVQTTVQKYEYNYLLAQKKAIEEDLAKYTAARQAEISEVNALIAECERLGIKQKEEIKDVLEGE